MKRDWLPLPFPEHMVQICGLERFAEAIEEAFKSSGEEFLQELKASDLVRAGDRVLELGCGCGRFARVLVDEPIASYVGFDRNSDMVAWCEQEFCPRDPRFSFRVLDVSSQEREDGGLSLRAPFEDDSFDFALLESLFDNVPLEQAQAHLRELGRVMAPGGRVVLSVFFAVGKSYADPSHHYYEPKAFWDVVEGAGFDHHLRGSQGTGGFRNWCVCLPRKGGPEERPE